MVWQVTSWVMQVYWSPAQEEPMRLRQVSAEQEATITPKAKIQSRVRAILKYWTVGEMEFSRSAPNNK